MKLVLVFTLFFAASAASVASVASLSAGVIHEKVLIIGVCRNVADPLPKTIDIIENIGSFFDDYRIIVYEENSKDRTPALLKEWQQRNNKVIVRSEVVEDAEFAKTCINREKSGVFFRPERIARARNIVLERALSDEFSDYPFVICMDMDFKYPPILEEGLIETFQTKTKWDAVFAYGIEPNGDYFDWYALRDDVRPLGPELLGRLWWELPKRRVTFKWKAPWYPVTSAFGGLAIYRKESIRHCRYSSLVTRDLETVASRIIDEKMKSNHPNVLTYFQTTCSLNAKAEILAPCGDLPKIENLQTAIFLNDKSNRLAWRMDTEVCQYPVTCEHVPFHASMIVQGHDKLYINPRLIMRY